MIQVVAYRIDLPNSLLPAAIEGRLVFRCEEHGEYEVHPGVDPREFEEWIEFHEAFMATKEEA